STDSEELAVSKRTRSAEGEGEEETEGAKSSRVDDWAEPDDDGTMEEDMSRTSTVSSKGRRRDEARAGDI
ncbi:hypothetical protein C4U21_14465, partial [Clostridioides difficile]